MSRFVLQLFIYLQTTLGMLLIFYYMSHNP